MDVNYTGKKIKFASNKLFPASPSSVFVLKPMSISLPVRPRSFTNWEKDVFSFLIDRMNLNVIYDNTLPNNDNTNPIERMKAVISYVIGGITCSLSQLKAFNPILGETY